MMVVVVAIVMVVVVYVVSLVVPHLGHFWCPVVREAISLKKRSKYGHCPNWLNPPPPLFWAVAEHFYA